MCTCHDETECHESKLLQGMDEVTSAIPHYEDEDIDDEAVPHDENIRVLNDCYEVIQVVGEGAYGLVMKCKVRDSFNTHTGFMEAASVSQGAPLRLSALGFGLG